MTQSSEELRSDQPVDESAAARTDRDLQRSALRELVQLATDCAAAEAQIEAKLAQSVAAAEQELDQTRTALSSKVEGLRQSVRKKHAERLAEAQGQFDFDSRVAGENDSAARSRVMSEYESAEQAVKQKLDQAVWLAESVFEGAQLQVRKDQAKAEEEYKAQKDHLVEMDSKAHALMRLYGQSRRDGSESEVTSPAPPPDDAAAAVEAHRERIASLLARLEHLQIPRLFVGATPYFVALIIIVLAATAAQLMYGPKVASGEDLMRIKPQWRELGYAAGGALVGLILIGTLLKLFGNAQVRKVYQPLRREIDEARRAAKVRFQHLNKKLESAYGHAMRKRDQEVRTARELAAP